MRIRETLTEIAIILATITIIVITVLLLKHSGTTDTTTETACVVTECRQGKDCYVVTVRDNSGNMWDYYDDTYIRNGYLVAVTFDGNAIVNVRR